MSDKNKTVLYSRLRNKIVIIITNIDFLEIDINFCTSICFISVKNTYQFMMSNAFHTFIHTICYSFVHLLPSL